MGALLGGLVGYYMFQPAIGFLVGALLGLATAVSLEYGLGQLGMDHWIHKRRVLLPVLLEIPLFVFDVAMGETQ